MNAALVRHLLEAARHSVDAALQLLDAPAPGRGPAAIPPAGPGVPDVGAPTTSNTLAGTPVTLLPCAHPSAQRLAIGGFGGEATGSFQCRACGVTGRS
jgi:hypothetical protein